MAKVNLLPGLTPEGFARIVRLSDFTLNKLYGGNVWLLDDGSSATLETFFVVPPDYSANAGFRMIIAAPASVGDTHLGLSYKTISLGGSIDPTSFDETKDGTVTIPSTPFAFFLISLSVLDSNFAANKLALIKLERFQSGDTLNAPIILMGFDFTYDTV